MWRWATGTPIVPATARCDSVGTSDSELIRIPGEAEFVGRRHVAQQRRRGDDGRTCEIAFAAETHAILPVPVERRNRPLTCGQRVRPLAKAGPAPRLTNLAAHGSKYARNGFTAEPRI